MKKILWVVTFALCSSVYANAQTIADIARRERARTQPPSSVSITNANLKRKAVITTEEKQAGEAPTTAPTPSTTAAATPTSATPPATTTAAQPTDPRDEKYWHEKFEAARTDIRRAENQVALAQLELNSANRDYLTRSYDPDGRGLTAISAAQQKLDDANKAVASGKAKIAQLEDDLRRAGAPAGWAR